MEPLTKELPDDGKGSQADEGVRMGCHGASPIEGSDVNLNRERLQLAASDRLAGGILTNHKGVGGARSSSSGKRSLARGTTDGHVLADDLADCHQAECEEEEDECNRSPLH
jgi:hypothetical protein